VLLWKQGTSLLERHLEQAVRDVVNLLNRTFVVIDGLDELQRVNDPDFLALCQFVGSLNAPRTDVILPSILICSRPDYIDIGSAMQGSAKICLDGEVNHVDMESFVEEKVASLGRLGRYEQQLKEDLVRRAHGVFRWVSAVVGYVQHMKSPRAKAEAVNNMSPALKDVYAKILERIIQQSDINNNYAAQALIWVTHAMRPLSVDEMAEALSIEPGMTHLDADNRIDQSHIDELCENCHGLLELSGGIYQLPHDSVRDFMLGSPDLRHSGLVDFWKLRSEAHQRLAEACLAYLNLEVFDLDEPMAACDMEMLSAEYPLLHYASCYWGDHLRAVSIPLSSDMKRLLQRFLLSNNRREVATRVMHEYPKTLDPRHNTTMPSGSIPEDSLPSPWYTTPLHLIAQYGLQQHMPGYGPDQKEQFCPNRFGFLPIDYAALRGSKPTFDWLLNALSHDAEARRLEGQSHYCLVGMAALFDWSDSLQKLLDMGFDKDGSKNDCRYLEPIHSAASKGSLQALTVLLDAGVNIDEVSWSYGHTTPLYVAAIHSQNDICQLLIDLGADINAYDIHGRTLLHQFASDAAQSHFVDTLLRRGAAFVRDKYGATPLHTAVERGHFEIVKMLCYHFGKSGINSMSTDMDQLEQKNAVQDAAERGHVEVVKVLLHEFGSDLLDDTYSDGMTFLHLAGISGEVDLIPLITDKAIDPNAQDAMGHTAVLIAAADGHDLFVKRLLETYPDLDLLLEDREGHLPLHLAAAGGYHDVVSLLSHKGADVPARLGRLHYIVLLCAATCNVFAC
jgi:ankyrin repeat protein